MGRVPRIDIGGEIYHVINRANAREKVPDTIYPDTIYPRKGT